MPGIVRQNIYNICHIHVYEYIEKYILSNMGKYPHSQFTHEKQRL